MEAEKLNPVNLETLTRPFVSSQIQSREGRGGKMNSYLETHSIITRLNEAFSGAWSFEVEVMAFPVSDAQILVKGRLTAGGVTKEQYGANEIDRRKGQSGEQGAPVSIGDDLKAAASDALKKCATLFGVGLELYEKKSQGTQRPAPAGPARQAGQATGERPTPWRPPAGREGKSRAANGATN